MSYKFAHVHKSYDTDQKEGKRIHFVQKFQRKANLIMYVYNLENLSFKRTELASQTLIRETVPVRPWPSVPAISLLLWKDWKQPTSLAVAHISGRRTKGCYTSSCPPLCTWPQTRKNHNTWGNREGYYHSCCVLWKKKGNSKITLPLKLLN